MISKKRTFFVWLGVLVTCAGFLYGRYDWSREAFDYSFRSWCLSFYLTSVFLPTLYYLLSAWKVSQRVCVSVTAVVGLLCTLPYRWLALQKFFFPLESAFFDDLKGRFSPQLSWLPEAMTTWPDFPGQTGLLILCLGLGWTAIALGFRKQSRQFQLGAAFLFTILVFQSFLHVSLRSPYTYIPHFEQAPEAQYWFHYYLFPDLAQGTVNHDYHVYAGIEQTLVGIQNAPTALLQRVFPHFLASLFTRFWNPFSVWLVLNIFYWAVLVGAVFYLARQWWGERIAVFAAVLATLAQGPIVYVAQPMPYVFGMMLAPLLVAVYIFLFDAKEFRKAHIALFSGLLGLAALSHSVQTWMLCFVLLAWVRKKFVRETLLAVALGWVVARGFISLCQSLPAIDFLAALPANLNPLTALENDLKGGRIFTVLMRLLRAPFSLTGTLLHAFPFIFIFALLGLWKSRRELRWKETALLFLPGILADAVMRLGGVFVYLNTSRLVYTSFPAFFLFASLFLDKLWDRHKFWVVLYLFFCFLYINADVFGLPAIYYLWFYKLPGWVLTDFW